VFLPAGPDALDPSNPPPSQTFARALAEPRLNAWAESIFGPLDDIGGSAIVRDKKGDPVGQPVAFYLGEMRIGRTGTALGLTPLDLLYACKSLPAGTGNTEIELRVRRVLRPDISEPDATIEIDFDDPPNATRSVEQAMEVGRTLLDLLADSTPLQPADLCRPEDGSPLAYAAGDATDVANRAQDAHDTLAEQDALLDAESTQWDALEVCSRFGIEAALFEQTVDVEARALRVQQVKEEIAKRTAAAQEFLSNTASVEPAIRVGAAASALKALFGDSFVVSTQFSAATVQPTEDPSLLLAGKAEDRVWLWLQQVAETHLRARKLETLLMVAEAWNPAGALKLGVLQLPVGYPWQALSDSELTPLADSVVRRASGCLSIVAAQPAEVDIGHLSGFRVDQWTETIPASDVKTGVSFEYNQPNSEAPQTILLAVPGNFDTKYWDPQHLAEIVKDTVDLSKVRLVDYDALPMLGGLLPALMFPIRKVVTPSVGFTVKPQAGFFVPQENP
jgi:hypothetical protein